ncbi:hypothetical protein Tco_0869529, partial [Tanacetum coccineum]
MKEELLLFKLQKVLTLMYLPMAKRAIGYLNGCQNKKDGKRLFLAYALFKDFMVYQWISTSAFFMVRLKRSLFVTPDLLTRLSGQRVKTASTHMETQKPLLKDEDGEEVDIPSHPKVSHLHAVKRIFRDLKGRPKLGLWYLKDSPFDLVAYTDSDYAGASLDRKSTTGGCQFLGCRLISWQCKKQTMVANSKTEAKYVAASSCCGQKGIGVNAGDSKLMLLGINLPLLKKVNATRHNLLLLV